MAGAKGQQPLVAVTFELKGSFNWFPPQNQLISFHLGRKKKHTHLSRTKYNMQNPNEIYVCLKHHFAHHSEIARVFFMILNQSCGSFLWAKGTKALCHCCARPQATMLELRAASLSNRCLDLQMERGLKCRLQKMF